MSPDQLAKMQAGAAAARAAKQATVVDEDAEWRARHDRALADHRARMDAQENVNA